MQRELQNVNQELQNLKSMVNISIQQLEVLFKLIIDKLKKDDLCEINLPVDEYWIVLTDEWNDFSTVPNLAVGSLVEDINYLKNSIKEGGIFTYSDFDRIAVLLRAISEQQAPS